jgi:hypothetical protein
VQFNEPSAYPAQKFFRLHLGGSRYARVGRTSGRRRFRIFGRQCANGARLGGFDPTDKNGLFHRPTPFARARVTLGLGEIYAPIPAAQCEEVHTGKEIFMRHLGTLRWLGRAIFPSLADLGRRARQANEAARSSALIGGAVASGPVEAQQQKVQPSGSFSADLLLC